MKKNIILYFLIALLLFSLAATPLRTTSVIDWFAIGPSSAHLQQNEIELLGVIGQGITGEVSTTQVNLCSGFLCLFTRYIQVYFFPFFSR